MTRIAIAGLLLLAVRVIASVLVAGDALWLWLSRLNDFKRIPDGPDGHDWAALAEPLDQTKKSAFFVDREDIEIAGEDAALYGDVVKAADAVDRAGFPGWTLVGPESLSARPRP